MESISPKELNRRLSDNDNDELLIDVREPAEYKGGRIPNASNIPLAKLHEVADKLKDVGTVYVNCASGNRSAHACQILAESGVNVVNVEGGIKAWEDAGFEIVSTGKKVIPIIRQVMILAGILIIAGVLLGNYINPLWYILSAFVGAGLLFAGITGICMMAKILSYLPWNKV